MVALSQQTIKKGKIMKSNKDVVIVGGGIIGLACAYYLSQKNASIRIIEQETIGSGASHGNCGLLYFSGVIPLCAPGVVKQEIYKTFFEQSALYIKPSLDFERLRWLFKFAGHCNLSHMDLASKAKNEFLRYSRDLFNMLFSDHDLKCDFEKKGLMVLFKDKKYFQKYKSTNNFLEKYGFGAKQLNKEETLCMEPCVNENIAGAFFNEHDWHLRPEMLVDSLKKLLIEKGVVIEENCKMMDFKINRNKISHITTRNNNYSADSFVLAAGAFSSQIMEKLNLSIPVQPGKGYSITMDIPEKFPQIPCMLYERNMVATPWKTGYRLGGTMEFSGFDHALSQKRLARLINGAKEYLKSDTKKLVHETWAGFRPMTYDDMPIIGRSPSQENLFVATGHGMLGITLATGTGKAVCDLIYEEKSPVNLEPFSIQRFI